MKRHIKLFLFILLIIAVMASCNKEFDYETEEPFIVVTSSPLGPDDFRNLYSSNYAIYDNGKLMLYTEPADDRKISDDAPMYETQIKQEEVEALKQLIEKNKFWELKEDLSNLDVMDGSSLYMTVNLTDESRTVGGQNPDDPKFTEVTDYVVDLVNDEDYKVWNENIKEHIFKLNP